MDINNILISSGITSALYGIYKGGIHIYKNYYLKSECHDQTLEITIVSSHPEVPPSEPVVHPPEIVL
jgi:hypothetical protein